MKMLHFIAAGGLVALGIIAVSATAAPGSRNQARNTPENWPYELRNKKRIPRVPRTVNPDGSWSEDYKSGNCRVARTGRPQEFREVRECD